MEDYIIKDKTNGRDLYFARQNRSEAQFQLWMSQRKPMTLDDQTLVHQLGIKSFKELTAYDKTHLNKQDSRAITNAILFSNVI